MKPVQSPDGRLVVGYVVRAHGIRGELRVRSASGALAKLARVFLDGKLHVVESARPDKQDLLVKLDGVADRTAAEALKGKRLEADRADVDAAAPLAAGEVWVADLIGCSLYDTAGALLGEVRDVLSTGAHETLVVFDSARRHEFLVPFVDAIVVTVDVAARRLVCDPPEGLLDLEGLDA